MDFAIKTLVHLHIIPDHFNCLYTPLGSWVMSYIGAYLYTLIPLIILLVLLHFADRDQDHLGARIGIGVVYVLLAWGITFWSRSTIVDVQRYAVIGSVVIFGIVFTLGVAAATDSGGKGFLAFLLSLGLLLGLWIPIGTQGLMIRAAYMEENTTIYKSTVANPIYPFNNTPSPDDFRFITEDFARSIAKQRSSDLGSNTEEASATVTRVNGTLYWCILYRNTQTVFQNYIMGMVLVDANDPNVDPIVIKTNDWNYADGLWFMNDLNNARYDYEQTNVWNTGDLSTADISGEGEAHYPAFDATLNKWVYVSTATVQTYWGGLVPNGLYITDVETGETLKYYSWAEVQAGTIPDYCIQIMSETYFEGMVNTWGNHRDTRKPGNINLYASWTVAVGGQSQDLFQWTEDTRYIANPDNPDEIIAILPLVPQNKPSTLYGYMYLDSQGKMAMYDMIALGLSAPAVAANTIESLLTNPNSGQYEAGMPILYYVTTASGVVPAYYVPIYWHNEGSNYRLSHFGIVSARDSSFNVLIDCSGKAPSVALLQAQINFTKLYTGSTTTNDNLIDGEITAIGSYMEDGGTIFVFATNNSDVIRLSRAYISDAVWNDVVLAQINDVIQYQYLETGEVKWCTAFIKVS